MKVREAMAASVEALDAESGIQEAAARMKDLGVGAIAVVDDGRPVGFLTDRDVLVRFVAEGLDFSGTTASDVMTRDVVSCEDDDELEEAVRLMKERGVNRLVVLDEVGELAGLLTREDAVRAMAEEVQRETHPRRQGRPGFLGPG